MSCLPLSPRRLPFSFLFFFSRKGTEAFRANFELNVRLDAKLRCQFAQGSYLPLHLAITRQKRERYTRAKNKEVKKKIGDTHFAFAAILFPSFYFWLTRFFSVSADYAFGWRLGTREEGHFLAFFVEES